MSNISLLIGRVLLAHIFLLAGINKIGAYSGTQAYMGSMGVSGELLPLVIALEIVAAVMALLAAYMESNGRMRHTITANSTRRTQCNEQEWSHFLRSAIISLFLK